MATLSKHDVHTEGVSNESWNNHVELGLWADIMLVAPCTATTLAKMANGIADNMVVACYLSAKCPVWVAPAMDLDMWLHGSTKRNLKLLQSFGNHIIPVGYGELASGLVGDGRMAESEDIVESLSGLFQKKNDLGNRKVIITAGPTQEDLDPVRFISNRSSGKMGIAIAEECADRGAEVVLVLGPTSQRSHHIGVTTEHVRSAQEMYEAMNAHHGTSDVSIFAAAVVDYCPSSVANKKIKKKDDDMAIALERTLDIAATLGKSKSDKQVHVGFALETNDEMKHAQGKLTRKNFDMVILNSLRDQGAGFQGDTNKVTILKHNSEPIQYPLKSKRLVAVDIIDELVGFL
jgi:phosphopantothenoylcysteine decarboxylase/phosphopantothenate--cysteine ligase